MQKFSFSTLAGAVLAVGLLGSGAAAASGTPVANTVFFHPDGTGLNHWTAARIYWKGPDGTLNWDRLGQMAAYRGHMSELLTGTSNGGATVHAFGYRVEGLGSFGKDGNGNATPPTDRFIHALSGFSGSLLREAASKGHPVGLVNDGNISEPGTAAFAAEVGNRDNWNAIALQVIAGRDTAQPIQNSRDRPIHVILGGGERNFLPAGTPTCAPASAGSTMQQGVATFPLNCMVHTLDWSKPAAAGSGPLGIGRVATPDRADGRNLLQEAAAAGYLVIRTRAEFAAVQSRLERERNWQPRILGLFAAHHTFNDRNEEDLIANGFRDAAVDVNAKTSNLVLFGNPRAADPGFNPPRGNELMGMAMLVLARAADQAAKPYFLVAEAESPDNFGNNNNAIGVLVSTQIADDMIGAVLRAQAARRADLFGSRFPTTVLTAADSDAGGMQLASLPAPLEKVAELPLNPAAGLAAFTSPLDGLYGRATQSFLAAPDKLGRRGSFGIVWAGSPDFAGGILARASTAQRAPRERRAGLHLSDFSSRFDNTDVYRFLHASLFGGLLKPPTTAAPDRR